MRCLQEYKFEGAALRTRSILDGKKTNAERVREFMQAFGDAVPDRPGFADRFAVLLRHSFIAEEYREFVEALLKADLAEVGVPV
jgi:predicted HAD superfamily Cof-like phosphohydrolase